MTADLNGVKMRSTGPMALPRYHHGDLRAALLREADAMLREQGLEALSLRRLAERAGVTAPALYHHFRDKNDLLCALAEGGFTELEERIVAATSDAKASRADYLRRFVRAYVGFAAESPEIYDLMFGRAIWKAGAPTDGLRAIAHASFRRYLERSAALSGVDVGRSKRSLRLAQASWATLHGLCRLLIDGIYVDREDLDAMSEQAAALLLAGIEAGSGKTGPGSTKPGAKVRGRVPEAGRERARERARPARGKGGAP